MTEDAPPHEGVTVPEELATLLDPSFTVVRRGYDQTEVRRAIIGLAGELSAGRERERLLAMQLADAQRRVEAVDPLDPSHLTKLLGDEVARILDAARAAAIEIRVRADDAATRLFEETKSEASEDAAAIIGQAEVEAREILRLAEQQRDDLMGVAPPGPVAAPSVAPGAAQPPRPPAPDRSRTADLFAALRQEQAEADRRSAD
jgi:cell division septum initiation protein DivIVA